MKVMLRIVGGLALVVALLVVVAFFLPRKFRVERGTIIKAKPEIVYAQLADLRAWKSWSAWHERDPQMKLSYSDRSTGVGAWSAWESKSEGNGKMTFTVVQPPRQIVYDLEFPDFGMKSVGTLTLAPVGDSVHVVWADEGDLGLNPVNRWFGVFLDRMIGPDFERGLTKLKSISETAAK
jgi:uncharacterized protein YndB with AHSA1/START domain